MSRTDCHRPGAIVPRDYTHLESYSGGAECEPPINLDTVRLLCEAVGWAREGRMWGHVGKCGVCGAHFRHGDLYRHEPTGHLVHMGHDCAEKYDMVADRDDWCAELEVLKRGRAARIEALRRQERYDWFCSRVEGLAAILESEHPILSDMKARLRQWGELSDKQIAFAFKLASEIRRPVRAETHVAAPEGRQVIRGTLVSKKSYDGMYGPSIKCTIKVATPAGTWLAWGTMPDALFGSSSDTRAEVGDVVELTATLTRGRDAHFALYKRPTKARLVEKVSKAA